MTVYYTNPEHKPEEEFDKVLVACPTYRGKSYALEAYINSYNNFTFAHRGLYMVDNTGDSWEYLEHLKKLGVRCDYEPPEKDWQKTFARCWKRIWLHARDNGYKWVASIEQDVIGPPLTLDIMLNVAGYTKALHIAHSYPWHKSQSEKGVLIGLGCNLLHVDLLSAIFNQQKWITDAFESETYAYPQFHGITMLEIHHLIDLKHMDGMGTEFYMFDRETVPEMTQGHTVERKPDEFRGGKLVA